MHVLNLYAGIGGNRKLWKNVKVVAIENNEEIARIYKDLFPEDEIIVEDAHDFLLKNYNDFDFIWSSPPCVTHSQIRYYCGVRGGRQKPCYPDLRLYEEIFFLQYHHKGLWVVENVKPYYKPLISPTVQLGRHYFWSNFNIPPKKFKDNKIPHVDINGSSTVYGFNLAKYKIKNKRQILRNLVNPEIGKYILEIAKSKRSKLWI